MEESVTKLAKSFLRRAAALLKKPDVWTKGTYGTYSESDAKFQQKCCAVGALAKVSKCKPGHVEGVSSFSCDTLETKAARKAGLLLNEVIGMKSIVWWNDSMNSAEPVVAAMRKAAKL